MDTVICNLGNICGNKMERQSWDDGMAMNRRAFLLCLPGLSLLRPAPTSEENPSLYLVQWFQWSNGTRCMLYWDGHNHWRAECRGMFRDYIHPRVWKELDEEFYQMQGDAQTMASQLMQEV